MNFFHKFCLSVLLLGVLFISSCHCDDDGMPDDPFTDCEWMFTIEPVIVDSCFSPAFTPFGTEIIPSYTVPYLYQVIPDENEDGIFYYILRRNDATGTSFELYRLDMCNVEMTFLTTIPTFSNSHVRLNGQNQLIYMTAIGEIHIYSIDDDIFSTPFPGVEVTEIRWLNDSLIIADQVYETDQGFTSRWMISNINTAEVIDTLELQRGEVTNPRNNIIALNTTPPASGDRRIYLYNLDDKEITTNYDLDEPFDRGLFLEYLSDTELVLNESPYLIASLNLETSEIEILRDSRDCLNVKYTSVVTLSNNTEEIMYIRTEYYYDENDNYLDKHELVRYNINTQVEEVVVF